jgi:N-acetylmuramoyl-L-alanine amidase
MCPWINNAAETACVIRGLSQNEVVSKLRILAGLLIVLAGCSTSHRSDDAPATESFGEVNVPMQNEHITESQPFAPPPGTAQPAPAAPTNHIALTWVSLKQWAEQNNVGPVQRISAGALPTFALRAPRGLLIVRANEQVAYWNSIELHLGFAPRLVTNEVYLRNLDITKNIEPLLHAQPLPLANNRVIVIDAGHGGTNYGTTSVLDGSHEKQYTLDWARRLAPILATNGWKVFLTRTNDTDISLENRTSIADTCKADVFISLHFNAPGSATDQGEMGIETYCVPPTGMPSTLKRYEENPGLVYTNNHFDAENLRYAMHVQRSILKVTGTRDRGVGRARFMKVLRDQNRPAILVEGGYLSNPREARHIEDPAYRQKLAEAVAAALIEKPVAHVTPPPEQSATNRPPAGAAEISEKAKTDN